MTSLSELVPMTVEELVFHLKNMPQDAIVYTDGCSCRGRAGSVEMAKDVEGRNMVIIRRPQ